MQSPKQPEVHKLNISHIWIEAFTTFPLQMQQQDLLHRFATKEKYSEEWRKVKQLGIQESSADTNLSNQNQSNTMGVLQTPWPGINDSHYIHHFWQYYLQNVEPNSLDVSECWNYLVPFMMRNPVLIASPWGNGEPKCNIWVQGYIYPNGVAAVFNIDINFSQQESEPNRVKPHGVGLTRMMDHVFDVSKKKLSVTFADQSTQSMKLDRIAEVVLNYLRKNTFGDDAPQGSRLSNPITIASVIEADGGNVDLPITSNGELHKVLEGLCSWKEDWANQKQLESIDNANLLLSTHPVGHILYHLEHGRATWMPKYHAPDSWPWQKQRKLKCFHRNLTLVSLQTEMLAQVCVLYREYFDRNEPPPPELKLLAKYIVDPEIRTIV